MELLSDPAILLLGIYSKKPKTLIWKNICTPIFTAALFPIAKLWKQPRYPSVDEWIEKAVVHICNGMFLGLKKQWNLTICDNMDGLEGSIKWNKSVRERQIPWFHLYVESKEQNKWTKCKWIHRYREQADGCQKGGIRD